MRDFLPEDVRRREYVIGIIKRVYERYGFEPLETPAVENLETLLGKYGDEGNKLIFKILKRGEHEKTGEADLALRYDLTVPLARVVAQHQAKLPRLFKRYQIQPVWRADRPARGRFREFYQCDVDSLGSTSPVVEAELCAAVADAMTELGFTEFRDPHQSSPSADRRVEACGVSGRARRRDARGRSTSSTRLARTASSRSGRRRVLATPRSLRTLQGLLRDRPRRRSTARRASSTTMRSARPRWRICGESSSCRAATSAGPRLTFDGTLARGLSYYTGAIMEVNVADLAGSLGGGGRYDNLVGMFSGQDIPACGFSLGLERILVVMTERGMFPPTLATSPADVMVATFDASAAADGDARGGRAAGRRTARARLPGCRQDRQADQVR